MHVPKPILFGLTLIGAVLLGWALRVTTTNLGAEPATMSAQQFATTIRNEIEGWKKVAKEANIKPE